MLATATTTLPPAPTLAEILFNPPGYWFLLGFVFMFGAIFGSFFNVAIYRMPLGLSVNHPKRSFCFRCGTAIRWHDNIPILSWFLLGGRCHACGAKFSIRYAMVELLTASLFVAVFAAHNPPGTESFSFATIWYLAFVGILIIGTFTDLDHWIIPTVLPRIGAIGALLAAVILCFVDRTSIITHGGPFPAILSRGDAFAKFEALLRGPVELGMAPEEIPVWAPIANALLGAIVAPVGLWLIGVVGKMAFKKDAMGFGDVELFVMIGATVGVLNSLIVLILASLFGSVGGGAAWLISRMRPAEESVLEKGEEFGAVDGGTTKPHQQQSRLRTSDEELAAARRMAEDLDVPFADLATNPPDDAAVAMIPADAGRDLRAIPMAVGEDFVRVALDSFPDVDKITRLREIFNRRIDFEIAAPSQIDALIASHFDASVDDPASPEDETSEANSLWKRYFEVASRVPRPRPVHHLPFIPWIALGAVVLVILYDPIRDWLNQLYFPTY